MDYGNKTLVIEYLFMGLTNSFQQQVALFLMFLFLYLVTLLGNLRMIALIWMDSQLHTPMYFFLSHLSFVGICSTSLIGPKMLTDIFLQEKVISFFGCAAQIWFFGQFVVTERFLLASMAYDRYVAMCKHLLCTLIMTQQVCVQLVVGPYAMGLMNTMTHTNFTFYLPYSSPNIINHFCNLRPVLSLACAETRINKFFLFILAGALGVLSGVIILVSYIYIVIAILRTRFSDGRHKAFSTCSSHLTAVSILYGTLFFIYVALSSSFSLDINKVVSVFYTAVIPMLNLLIYSLRKKEVEDTLRNIFKRKKFLVCR